MKTLRLTDPYSSAIRFSIAQQAVILFFTSCILDGGTILAIAFYAALGFWAGYAAIRFRRPVPSKTDVLFVRYGYIPLCLISLYIALLSHHGKLY